MFSQDLPTILKVLDIGRAPMPRAATSRTAETIERAHAALESPVGFLPLSRRMAAPAEYRALQKRRRDELEWMMLAPDVAGAMERALDLIAAILEEPIWAASAEQPFEDVARPSIDLQAADTAALLGWAARIGGTALERRCPGALARMLHQVRMRVVDPLIRHDDYICSVATLCAAATALLLLERNEHALSQALRPMLRILDATCAIDESSRLPLADRLADASALADFSAFMKRVTSGAADLTHALPYAAWLDELLFSHVVDCWFFDPAGDSMRPQLSGQALFRLGLLTGDGALRSLGAALNRARPTPSPTATGRLFDHAHRDALDGELSPAPRLKNAATEDGRVLIARGAGFVAMLTSGGDRANVGDISVFLDGVPVLTSKNLPLAQLPKPLAAPAPDWDFSEPERAIMGVDVTAAYAAEPRVRAHQRTLVLARAEYGVQLVDVFDLAAPGEMRHAFHTPHRPEFFDGGARLGPMLLRWEGTPEANAHRLAPSADFPEGEWELSLLYPEIPARAMFTFFMRHA